MSGPALGPGVGRRQRRLLLAAPPVPPAAFPAQPLLAVVGASRVRQAAVGMLNGAKQQCEGLAGGMLAWVLALRPQIRSATWYEADAAKQNSFVMNGLVFAKDGTGMGTVRASRPKLLSTDADLVYFEGTSSSIQTGVTVASVTGEWKDEINAYAAAGKRVIFGTLPERTGLGSNIPAPWVYGAPPRLLLDAINAEMIAWAASRSDTVRVADIRSVLVNMSDPNREPHPWAVRDGTHYAPRGAYEAAKVFCAAVDPWLGAAPAAARGTGPERLANAAMSGAGGTVSGAGVAGAAPDGWTLSRAGSGTLGLVTAAKETRNGVEGVRFTIDASALPEVVGGGTTGSGQAEGVRLEIPVPGLVAGEWVSGSCRAEVGAWDGWRTTARVALSDAGGSSASALSGINPSGTPMGSPSFSQIPLPMPAEAMSLRPETWPLKVVASGTGLLSVQVFFSKSATPGVLWIGAPSVKGHASPEALLWNEADTTPIAIRSAAAFSTPEEEPFAFQIATNKPFARFALSGADAARFSVDAFGRVAMIATPDFEAPTDANKDNLYEIAVAAADFNPANGAAAQSVTVAVTDVDDGFSDNFNRANEPLETSPNWTLAPGSGAGVLNVVSNRAGAASGTSAAAFAPPQGDTPFLRVTWRASGSASTGGVVLLRAVDRLNWVGFRGVAGGSQLLLQSRTNGTDATLGAFALYKTFGAGDLFQAQIVDENGAHRVQLFQNGVPLALASGASDVTAHHPAGRRSGLLASGGGNNNLADDWNNRVAAPIAPRVGLYALGVAPTNAPAGADYAGAVLGKTSDSAIDVASVSGPGGTWLADGAVLRGTDLLPGAHALTLRETLPDAVNDGRLSAVTVTVS